MDSLIMPQRFAEKLEKDAIWESIVKEIIRRFSSIIKENKMEFFPEYTDHGFNHINKTLELANKIIPQSTFDKLNTLDIGALVVSFFLHDLGMHLTYETFIELITDKSESTIDKSIDNKSWSMLWDEYLAEAKLWSSKKIKAMFDDDFEIKQPPIKRGDATEKDRKFIGEFIRRNHPRLAYEICMFGFPKVNGEKMELSSDLDKKLKKVVGLIARSHGMNLWGAVQSVENEFGRNQIKAPRNVHAIYLMVLIRISDYFDMDKTRANTPILNFKKIYSSISEMEWIKHNTVEYVAMEYQDDPESIFVYINEITESKVYLAINNLLTDMQKELDTCWAVLGKVYGAYENLQLTIRRIHSNMEDKDIFLKGVNFIPERIKFDSNPDILKLLVQPLYGNDPAYGIRELLQNAIDACIEKEKILLDEDSTKVVLTISEDENCLTMEDTGIGMNKDILINYFLVAGASFRNSDTWKRVYCNNNKSTIPRSGRFGVGVFASFLIGDEIYVETKRYNEEIGYKFTANIETDQIQVIKFRSDKTKSGTKIIIKLNDGIIEELKNQYQKNTREVHWNRWYFAKKPEYVINVPSSWKEAKDYRLLNVHLYDEDLEEHWRSIKPEGYYRVDWTYKENENFYCNGIAIQGSYNIYKLEKYRFPSYFLLPSVSVVDNDANLPLNLDRNGISNKKLPFESELVCDIYKDIIAKLLISKDISKIEGDTIIIKNTELSHPAIGGYHWISQPLESNELLLTRDGFNILHHFVIKNLKRKCIFKIWVNDRTEKINDSKLVSKIDQVVISKENMTSIQKFKQVMDVNSKINLGHDYDVNNIRVFIKKKDYNYIFENGKNRMRSGFVNSMIIESESENWYCIIYGDVPETKLNIQDFERNSSDINLFIEYYFIPIQDGLKYGDDAAADIDSMYYREYYKNYFYESTIFEDNMAYYLGQDTNIPYNIDERVDKYKKAFRELRNYMKKLESNKLNT